MSSKKYYVVVVGKHPGIYNSSKEAQAQLKGVQNGYVRAFSKKSVAQSVYKKTRGKKYATADIAKQAVENIINPKPYYLVWNYNEYKILQNKSDLDSTAKEIKGSRISKFATKEAAVAFAKNNIRRVKKQIVSSKITQGKQTYAFIDGSYNPQISLGGYGCAFVHNGTIQAIQGKVAENNLANVAAELVSAKSAIKHAIDINASELTLFYDFSGIEDYITAYESTGKEDKNSFVAEYQKYVSEAKKHLNLTFSKVKAHSGIVGNNVADRLAFGAY